MSEFSHHEACPSCGSKDNLGVWQDGHKWCFGCGFYIPGYKTMSVKDIEQQLRRQEKKKTANNDIHLPDDFSSSIAKPALDWLMQYGLTEEEIHHNHIGWSHARHALIFAFFDPSGNLLLYQERNFNPDIVGRKYFTQGFPDDNFIIYFPNGASSSRRLVLVEDVVSAIKVGRQFPCAPLFGSQVSLDRIRRASDRFEELVLWLDKDKALESLKTKIRASPYFNKVTTIVTDLDPKEYSDHDINEFLAG